MNTEDRIILIGDSFTANASDFKKNESEQEVFFIKELNKFFNRKIMNYSQESRDIQTIFDIWIKILPKIRENDFLIVCVPYYSRWRFPLSKRKQYNEPHNPYNIDVNYYDDEDFVKIRHIGQNNAWSDNSRNIEGFGDFIDDTIDGIRERYIFNEFFHSSEASSMNNKEIIESLLNLSKCKTFIFSWTRFKDGFKPKGLYDKTDLEKELGYWGTQHDVYNKTNGKYGYRGDLHWDEHTHKKLGEYLINYFK
tara:strand:+ start:152 stop:904 length:753 start_codon:yes stop_codon:yes gene_type:complete